MGQVLELERRGLELEPVVRRRGGFHPRDLVAPLTPNHALEPTAASGLRALAVPSALRASAAAQRERSASGGSNDG
jgi:hypothetical protein